MRTGNHLRIGSARVKIGLGRIKIRATTRAMIRVIMRSAMTARKINIGGKRRLFRRLTCRIGCATCRRRIVSG